MGLFLDKDTALSENIKCNYHRIVEFSYNSTTNTTIVAIASYISESDEEAGKAPYSSASYKLYSVNPLQLIQESQVGVPVFAIVQNMLEQAIVSDVPEFNGAVIG